MQSIYAMHQNGSDNLEKEEKFLFYSIDAIQDLYLIMLSSLIEICKQETIFLHKSSQKHLATPQERKPNEKFIKNSIFQILAENNSLSIALENRKINNWTLNDDYILLLLNDIKKSKLYSKYMSNAVNTFEEDKEFIADLFQEVIVPNENLLCAANDVIDPILQQIIRNSLRVNTLASLRDSLLPRLISGQLSLETNVSERVCV
jgi:N utilization substance protein B